MNTIILSTKFCRTALGYNFLPMSDHLSTAGWSAALTSRHATQRSIHMGGFQRHVEWRYWRKRAESPSLAHRPINVALGSSVPFETIPIRARILE